MTLWRVLGILFLSLWYLSGPREWGSWPCFLLFKTIVRELRAVLFSRSAVSNSLQPHELQHARLPYPLLSPWVCSNSCPLSHWCHPTISSSGTATREKPITPFFFCPPNLSQHQGLFHWVSSLHQVAKVLELRLQYQSFQWTPKTDFL